MTEPLTLYNLEFCPFCRKVRRAADRLGIELKLVDVGEHPNARRHLVDRLGRGTVPVLGIQTSQGETLLPESDDIVAYLETLTSPSRPEAA